jgi:hypothetical protein
MATLRWQAWHQVNGQTRNALGHFPSLMLAEHLAPSPLTRVLVPADVLEAPTRLRFLGMPEDVLDLLMAAEAIGPGAGSQGMSADQVGVVRRALAVALGIPNPR